MKKNQTYLVVDTETGGLDPRKHSILSCSIPFPLPSKFSVIFSKYIIIELLFCSITVSDMLFGFKIVDKRELINQREAAFVSTNKNEQTNEIEICSL